MIGRYTRKEIGEIWVDERKFNEWLNTELAVIETREENGIYPKGTTNTIRSQVILSVGRIKEIEKDLKHDLLAFVQAFCESIEESLRKFVHQNITSYDTEEPAQARQIIASLDLIIAAAENLYEILLKRAQEFRGLKTVGRTHAKKAQIKIFGLYFLVYADMVEFVIRKLKDAREEMTYSKLSGAVGSYNRDLSPKFEERVLVKLGLKPVKIATQIVQRHRLAYTVEMLSLSGVVVGNIAENVWLWIHRDVANEPFGNKQKGSSAMPHKKNAIISEQILGLTTRSLVMKSIPALLNVISREDRDIAHSSVERTEITDAFILCFYVLTAAQVLVKDLVIYRERIREEILTAHQLVFSERVKTYLEALTDKESAYRIVQKTCFLAWEESIDLSKVLLENEEFLAVALDVKESKEKNLPLPQSFTNLFIEDPDLIHIDEIYQRFGL